MPAPGHERGQMLLAEEYFAGENPAFLETLRGGNQPKTLAGFADRLKKDAGHLAAATSTGGRTGKPAGRVGASAIVGAGLYADDLSCALSCTGRGEDFVRTVLAKTVAERVRYAGLTAEAGADAGMAELARVAGSGGLILVDRAGDCAARFNTERMLYAWIEHGGEARVVV